MMVRSHMMQRCVLHCVLRGKPAHAGHDPSSPQRYVLLDEAVLNHLRAMSCHILHNRSAAIDDPVCFLFPPGLDVAAL